MYVVATKLCSIHLTHVCAQLVSLRLSCYQDSKLPIYTFAFCVALLSSACAYTCLPCCLLPPSCEVTLAAAFDCSVPGGLLLPAPACLPAICLCKSSHYCPSESAIACRCLLLPVADCPCQSQPVLANQYLLQPIIVCSNDGLCLPGDA